MGRKPIADDRMHQTFSFRGSSRVAQFLEKLRGLNEQQGERASTSDVVRKIVEAAVDQDLPSGFVVDAEEVLRRAVRAWRDGGVLKHSDYALLAEHAHSAYLMSRRSHCRADLLLNNLDAFEAFIRLRDGSRSRGASRPADSDLYFYSKLDADPATSPTLIDAIEHARALVRRKEANLPRDTAEYFSRNLQVALRDTPPFPASEIDRALRPYLKGLLLLALKGYAVEHGAPVDAIGDAKASAQEKALFAQRTFQNDEFMLRLTEAETGFSALLTPAHEEWYLSLTTEKFLDLLPALRALNDQKTDHYFVAIVQIGKLYRFGELTSSGGHFFGEERMHSLVRLFEEVANNPAYQRMFEAFELRYGSL